MPTEDARPIVFISYSHDSGAHFTLVRGLSASLARDGCDCRLDANKETEDTGEDWPTWMTRQLREADFVFCVITQTYQRRFDGEEKPEAGRGVAWEAGLIRRILYNDKLKNHRIFPVLFKQADQQHIPLLLQYDHFVLDGASGYEKLIRKITNQPVHLPPTSGSAPALSAKPTEPLFPRPVSDVPDESPSGTSVEADGDAPDLADEENRKARQARQFSKMVEALDKKKAAVDALSESLRTFVKDAGPLDDTKSLINFIQYLDG